MYPSCAPSASPAINGNLYANPSTVRLIPGCISIRDGVPQEMKAQDASCRYVAEQHRLSACPFSNS